MGKIKLFRDEPFTTFEAADALGMGEHRAQVVAWVRRHVTPFDIDKTNPKKEIYKLDLINIVELFLLRELKRHNVTLGDINRVVNKEQVLELLENDSRNYLMILGAVPLIVNNPMALWSRSKGAASAFLIDFMEIKRQVLAGILKVRK